MHRQHKRDWIIGIGCGSDCAQIRGSEMNEERPDMGEAYAASLKKLVNMKLQYAFARQEGTNAQQAAGQKLAEAEDAFSRDCARMLEEGAGLYLEYLLERFGLSEFEKHCVRLLYVFETDRDCAKAAACLQDGWGHVTPYLAGLTYGRHVGWQQLYGAFCDNSLLSRFFLEDDPDCAMLCMRKLRLAKRIVEFALGNVAPGPAYEQIMCHWDETKELKPWIGTPDGQIGTWWEWAILQAKPGQGKLLYLYGEAGSGKRFSVLHTCRQQGYPCCLVNLDKCMKKTEYMDEAERYRWMEGLLRELMLFDEVPVLFTEQSRKEALSDMLAQQEIEALLGQVSEAIPIAFLCAPHKVYLRNDSAVTYFYKRPMTLLEGKEYWETEGRNYPLEEGLDLGVMSNKFRLAPGKISRILETANKARIQNREKYLSQTRITRECYGMIEQQMGKKAVKVPAIYGMEDLVLPKRQKCQLMDACNQVRYKHKVYEEWGFQEKVAYGRGVSMVFCGPPGTGKTMAAQVIARELNMELYKVDLSCVVSKYVGETEKNLDWIFEQAKESQVILFFDEADALFGKRSEGKESIDKYSNMEAAFLLQKMECYDGITILATNLFHHLDEAFKRRLKIIVECPLPGVAETTRLWQTMIPSQMPAGEIDYDYLARQFELSGSNIRNVLLHSAFLAASRGKSLDMEEIIPAIKNEYAKNGKNLTKNDVSEYYMYLDS